jgi:hypothetical protein
MSDPTPTASSNFWAGVLRTLKRLLITLGILAVIAGLLYLTAFYVYPNLIAPVQKNSADLIDIATRQAQDNQQLGVRISTQSARISSLEAQKSQQGEQIAELQARMTAAEQTLLSDASDLAKLDQFSAQLDSLDQQVRANQAATGNLTSELQDPDSPLASLQREVQLIKVMDLVNRSRLMIDQNDPGLAKQDLAAAKTMLAAIEKGAPASVVDTLGGLNDRIDLALAELPDYPALATSDVDILWQMLLSGMSGMPGEVHNFNLDCTAVSCSTATPSLPEGITPTPPLITPPSARSTPSATLPAGAPRATFTSTPTQLP